MNMPAARVGVEEKLLFLVERAVERIAQTANEHRGVGVRRVDDQNVARLVVRDKIPLLIDDQAGGLADAGAERRACGRSPFELFEATAAIGDEQIAGLIDGRAFDIFCLELLLDRVAALGILVDRTCSEVHDVNVAFRVGCNVDPDRSHPYRCRLVPSRSS